MEVLRRNVIQLQRRTHIQLKQIQNGKRSVTIRLSGLMDSSGVSSGPVAFSITEDETRFTAGGVVTGLTTPLH